MKARWVFLVSTLAAGCGGGGNGGVTVGSCGVLPCGGDVVGDWTASSACIDRATLNMDFLAGLMGACPTASVDSVSLTANGTLSLARDMTFTGALSFSSTTDINHPAACNEGATCAQLAQTLQTTVGTNGITSITCTGSGSCSCTMDQTIDIIKNTTGTWATSGTMLTFAGAPGGNGPYCVQGSSLHLVGYDLATMTKIVSDFVLTKQ